MDAPITIGNTFLAIDACNSVSAIDGRANAGNPADVCLTVLEGFDVLIDDVYVIVRRSTGSQIGRVQGKLGGRLDVA